MRKVFLGTVAVIGALVLPASALAAQTLTLTPKLTGKLGGEGQVTFAFTIANSLGGVPSPLSGNLTAELPVGVSYASVAAAAKEFPVCPIATINVATGSTPPACPKGSQVGSGTATFQAQLGAQLINEPAVIDAYLSAASPVTITFWGSGTSPINETQIFSGRLLPDSAPYGEKLVTAVPTITTVPGGPDASITQFSSTIGSAVTVKKTTTVKKGKKKIKKTVSTSVPFISLPKKCPSSSLSWNATANFEDGSTLMQPATTTCSLT